MSKIVNAAVHEQSVKVAYRGTMRRFTASSYEVLRQRLQKLLELNDAALVISYVDDEGDEIRLSSPEDFEEALKSCGELLRITVHSSETNPSSPAAALAREGGDDQQGWEGGYFKNKGWLLWKAPSHGKGWDFEDPCKGKGKGWHAKGKGKGKGWHGEDYEWMGHHFSEDDAEVAKRLEAAAGKRLCMRRMYKIMKRANWKIEHAEDVLGKRRERREARQELRKERREKKEACLEGTAKLAEIFPDVPLRKVKWALAKAGGDVEVAASNMSGLLKRKREAKEEFMLKGKALAERLQEAGHPRGPARIMQLLKKTGGDVEAAVKIVESNVALRRSKGKGAWGKGKGWHCAKMDLAPCAAESDSSSSSSSDSDSEV